MAFWLAHSRNGQDSDYIQRFDPRFWTVDFPRPAMASVVTTAADALRVDVEFHHRNALVGLIWDSADRHDHPLMAYATDRDYARTHLRFRWRSAGILALDAVNGPTLTIEGHDAEGQARTWYIRLWNYADGTPHDAVIDLPFSDLFGGWDSATSTDAVHPSAIDRLFISLAPAGYDASSSARLPTRVDGWAELTGITCTGDRPMLPIGDVMLPPHGLCMATAYDDSYHLTPARILRCVRGLGYRGAITHYVGMSHYYRLGGGAELAAIPELCGPAQAWHRSFLALCAARGFAPIISLSFELLAQHCPPAWPQRFADGSQALTGWSPPSTLLSPANPAAMAFLETIASRFVALVEEKGLPVAFQIGEPWWWTTSDGRIALYDAAARTALGGDPPTIADMRAPLDPAHLNLLDNAGTILATATAALRDAVNQAAIGPAEIMLLVFTPTVLDPAMPHLHRANLPAAWAYPAYDRLQLEDYDWLTNGRDADRFAALAIVQQRLAYPLMRQDYLAGFVLQPTDSDSLWPLIDAAVDEAEARGVGRRFVWALPQVCRDGYTRLPVTGDQPMHAFDDVAYPLPLGRDASVSAEFSTSVVITASGFEHRNSHWANARLHFDVGPGVRSEAEMATLITFFRARRGSAVGFRLRDPLDFSSRAMTGVPTPHDQLLGLGDGGKSRFRLQKTYDGPQPQVRLISRPVAGTVVVSIGGTGSTAFTLEEGGFVRLHQAPASGVEVRAGFLFDVPVRFASDRLDINAAHFAAGEAASVPLVELKEP